VKVCEPAALSLTAGTPARLTLDQDVCTRCGECVHACPEGAIAMLRLVWEERLVDSPLAMRSRPGGSSPSGRAEGSTVTARQGRA
jgi:ferredoxin